MKGKKVTGFTDSEEDAVHLEKVVPFYFGGNRMKELGGKFEKGEKFQPYVVSDGKLITGQNPASSFVAAQKVIKVLEKK